MSKEKIDVLGPLLTELGEDAASVIDGDPNGAYIFASAGEGWAGGAIFVEGPDAVRCLEPSHEFFELVMKIWETDNMEREEADRWGYMEYVIHDGKFNASFVYPESLPPGTDDSDWQDAALEKRFGSKPIIWPDFPKAE